VFKKIYSIYSDFLLSDIYIYLNYLYVIIYMYKERNLKVIYKL